MKLQHLFGWLFVLEKLLLLLLTPVLWVFDWLWRKQKPHRLRPNSSDVPRCVGSPGQGQAWAELEVGLWIRKACGQSSELAAAGEYWHRPFLLCLWYSPVCWGQPEKWLEGQCSGLCSSKARRCSGTSSSPLDNVLKHFSVCNLFLLPSNHWEQVSVGRRDSLSMRRSLK